ncbi:phenylalanyl-tRNA synthetase alpha chain [Tetragenococcus halophilus subsp. halophilus]|uniref:Phenylalanine--tRNA ligase alpha subunit n=1 Tax=Tetragenococcus halophilus (strain DSM 20338 / JCM 20259 / NCIMB 9735 / NBRC 12172) TaxID=945021 RepID=A0AAN1SHF5_TETHN|nr:phenylalanine--tRNA ligase subunit alpha [Tetragenococcus halophilus]NWN99532.1 phenylalanine--tRNA ligase subunit alpha [Tetragenococcus halophilus]RQD32702.1 phenylalanine--tRNA ligase subunit alpha [Tetragenococcus halophilus subsp. halophilus DSM 20339]WJS81000.1 phenylalanine--tRNA ligase subunit alpha [Tetragenococcus halophilus]BAK94646.1 phenylalanyl-tRNA synthetase alpha chain [Tetragenococcus halophilus NBRC 12172]GBD58987.1 phenylalanyl-tRNA synthetase alpha chain [Tetragenococcu
MTLEEQLENLEKETMEKISNISDLDSLNDIRVKTLGKKGPITEVLRGMKDLTPEDRPKVGSFANQVRDHLTQQIEEKRAKLEEEALNQALAEESIDVTLPGKQIPQGTRHILTKIVEEIEDIFVGMGYQIIEGPEVEQDHYNFERMNIPKNHPARDMQDTFYISDELLIRTHTSPVQARTMEKHDFSKGPLRMISPGKVFRRDTDDATHSHQFHQIEGLVVDKHITMGDLKGTLEELMKKMFGENREVRLRPSYFPFTEPSVEADVSCFKCGGKGCSVCKHSGWIEILGSGMVHPDVLEMSGIDPKEYSGFAFGLGPDRIAMLRYGVEDIRSFYLNDTRFIDQFKGE